MAVSTNLVESPRRALWLPVHEDHTPFTGGSKVALPADSHVVVWYHSDVSGLSAGICEYLGISSIYVYAAASRPVLVDPRRVLNERFELRFRRAYLSQLHLDFCLEKLVSWESMGTRLLAVILVNISHGFLPELIRKYNPRYAQPDLTVQEEERNPYKQVAELLLEKEVFTRFVVRHNSHINALIPGNHQHIRAALFVVVTGISNALLYQGLAAGEPAGRLGRLGWAQMQNRVVRMRWMSVGRAWVLGQPGGYQEMRFCDVAVFARGGAAAASVTAITRLGINANPSGPLLPTSSSYIFAIEHFLSL
ncbi:hypothetical protein FIBSPDRAFT_883173 [Athelia psychrophila]|uniref:Uncharacterized protein n=1 Tax=Athelia psychrophila TaxID=1759441 RepID=A0A166UMV1_9AGAM|nr:hypothetical protein FIBSPDRAFT_883173 [Fibularhizoctonia sp. CBS 109695]